jgi:RNA polymerase sigma-70 factor, ECF subfamily
MFTPLSRPPKHMDYAALETTELVQRACADDRQAFAALVDRYESGVYSHLLTRTRDPGRAQEATQDAFVTALTRLPHLEKPASFRSWVIGIGINLLRRRKKEIADNDLLTGARDKRLTGLAQLADQERLDAVRAAIADLPENYRTALQMHYFDRQRGRVIGNELGVSEGAVHMILLRARKALAEKLKAFDPESD